MKEGEEGDSANESIRLWNLSALLHAHENGVLGELYVVHRVIGSSVSSTNDPKSG